MEGPSVFVSYAHEGDTFREQVRQFCLWLRSKKVNVVCDLDYAIKAPPQGWQSWMQHGIENAQVVLVIASPKYKARFEKRAKPDAGKGVAWEGAIITQDLYDAAQWNDKFFPILPSEGHFEDVPKALTPWFNNHRFPCTQKNILALINECIGKETKNTVIPKARDKSPSIELEDDKIRIKQVHTNLKKLIGREHFTNIAGLAFTDDLPSKISQLFNEQKTRLKIADDCMLYILDFAEQVVLNINSVQTTAAQITGERKTELRARLINAMQQAILLSARTERLHNVNIGATYKGGGELLKLDVEHWETVSVLLRDELAKHLGADFDEGKDVKFKDEKHLNISSDIEFGTFKSESQTGAKVEILKIIYRHLFPNDKLPKTLNEDSLQGGLRLLKRKGNHMLAIFDSKSSNHTPDFLQWLSDDMHVGVISITTKQGVFEAKLSEGTWLAMLKELYKILIPFEPEHKPK